MERKQILVKIASKEKISNTSFSVNTLALTFDDSGENNLYSIYQYAVCFPSATFLDIVLSMDPNMPTFGNKYCE